VVAALGGRDADRTSLTTILTNKFAATLTPDKQICGHFKVAADQMIAHRHSNDNLARQLQAHV